MRLLFYEDAFCEGLNPVALMRPVFDLVCGRESLIRRVQRWFPAAAVAVSIRPWLADVYREEHPLFGVNPDFRAAKESMLFINGRWLPEKRLEAAEVSLQNAGFIDGDLAWIALQPEEVRELGDEATAGRLYQLANARRIVEASGRMVRYPWDLVNQNGNQLIRDFTDEGLSQTPQSPLVQILGDERDVYISARADIDPFVVIDARNGPVSIDQGAAIQSFTRIEGPCHVARGASVFRALIRQGTTIGENCRVGGEVENSILHSDVNKYHEGFLGHSYVCPWVNLGAITTTSDLKNDYSSVRVPLSGIPIDSGTVKVGSYIGDHSKTAIDSMFNTGSSIGVMAMVLPGGRLLPRHIPSFCNVSFGELAADWPLDNSIETARTVLQRRGRVLTEAAEVLIRYLHQQTAGERQEAMDRAVRNRLQR
ncbi:MAG: hypothetical protein KDA85_01935 [Planctomycetaceae bacterium]|nr:hypothetical protein [Planctomycetaceae bacterium]